MLWGSQARNLSNFIDHWQNLVIEEIHPSPRSCVEYRKEKSRALKKFAQVGHTFKTTRCFSQCNSYLSENARVPIDWDIFKNRYM